MLQTLVCTSKPHSPSKERSQTSPPILSFMLSYKTTTSEQSQCTFKMREEKKFRDFMTTDLNWYRRYHIKPTLSVGLKGDAYTEPRQDTVYCPRTESGPLWSKIHYVLDRPGEFFPKMTISSLRLEGSADGISGVHCGINPTQHLYIGGGFVTSIMCPLTRRS